MLKFHGAFSVVAAAVLAKAFDVQSPYPSGVAVSLLVLLYSVAFHVLARHTHTKLHSKFVFASILSIFQVVPDLFLDAVLGTLHFPDDGCPRLFGHVSAYMAGMWTIPLLGILWFSERNDEHNNNHEHTNVVAGGIELPTRHALFKAGAAALVVFGSAEQLTHPLGLWHATGKVRYTLGNVAVYVLLPEALLGCAALFAYTMTSSPSTRLHHKIGAAASVSMFYTGALAVSFLFTEQLLQ